MKKKKSKNQKQFKKSKKRKKNSRNERLLLFILRWRKILFSKNKDFLQTLLLKDLFWNAKIWEHWFHSKEHWYRLRYWNRKLVFNGVWENFLSEFRRRRNLCRVQYHRITRVANTGVCWWKQHSECCRMERYWNGW